MDWSKKEILEELKDLATKLNINLKDLIFDNNSDIIFMKNSDNIKQNFSDKIIATSEFDEEKKVLTNRITVPDWYKSQKPIQMCFFLEWNESSQKIKNYINIGDNANVNFFASCFGIKAQGEHIDDKNIKIWKNSKCNIYEFHYNTEETYTTTVTNSKITIWENSEFFNEFIGRNWNIWNLRKISDIELWNYAYTNLTSKLDLKENDRLYSYNKIKLKWKESKALIKSNSITRENTKNYFKGIMEWIWDNSRWHIECDEILLWNWQIQSLPELKVENPTSRLTHESAIWTLEKENIDNLIIKWLTEEEAVNFLIKWHLK